MSAEDQQSRHSSALRKAFAWTLQEGFSNARGSMNGRQYLAIVAALLFFVKFFLWCEGKKRQWDWEARQVPSNAAFFKQKQGHLFPNQLPLPPKVLHSIKQSFQVPNYVPKRAKVKRLSPKPVTRLVRMLPIKKSIAVEIKKVEPKKIAKPVEKIVEKKVLVIIKTPTTEVKRLHFEPVPDIEDIARLPKQRSDEEF